jgi:hypothetical protein
LDEMLDYTKLKVEEGPTGVLMAILQLTILTLLPIFSAVFLRRNNERLGEEDFNRSYGTLYQGIKVHSPSCHFFTTFFCIRRLLIAVITVNSNWLLISNIYISIFGSLAMIKLLFDYSPFQDRVIDRFEKINEIFYLLNCYFLFLFTDFVGDPLTRYNFGYLFIALMSLVMCINITMVTIDLLKQVRHKWNKRKYVRLWDEHKKLLDRMAQFIVYHHMLSNPG